LLHKELRRTGHSSGSSDNILWELPPKEGEVEVLHYCFLSALNMDQKEARAREVMVSLLQDSLFSEVSVHWSMIWLPFNLGSFRSLLTWLLLDGLSLHLFCREAGKFLLFRLRQDAEVSDRFKEVVMVQMELS
jgi:hypothetical protein